jgi:hypothetical protein
MSVRSLGLQLHRLHQVFQRDPVVDQVHAEADAFEQRAALFGQRALLIAGVL